MSSNSRNCRAAEARGWRQLSLQWSRQPARKIGRSPAGRSANQCQGCLRRNVELARIGVIEQHARPLLQHVWIDAFRLSSDDAPLP